MANTLNIVVLPTYDTNTIAIGDASTYDTDPPSVTSPEITITFPGFDPVVLTFVPGETNIFNSTDLGITTTGNEQALPDGVYCLKYSVEEDDAYIEKNIMRVDQLMEKFDGAFMKLDLMECDRPLKTQSKVDLMSIYFFIQGAIASANNCANVESEKLYLQADKMLNTFLYNDCGCTGVNFLINYY